MTPSHPSQPAPDRGPQPATRPRSAHARGDAIRARLLGARRRSLRALLLIPAIIAAAALAGCFQIIGQTTVQDGEIGDVIVDTEMCLNNGTAGCEAGLSDTLNDGDVQYLFGYLIPTWANEPQTVAWNGDAGNQVLARDVNYEATLQAFAPAPLGLHWIGYSSGRRPAPPVGVDQRMHAIGRIGIPGTIAPGLLQLATVTGWRVIRDPAGSKPGLAIDRAFNCNENTDGLPTTVCILSGSPEQATTPGNTPNADDIALSTVSLGTPAEVSARAGSIATIEFPQQSNWKGEGNDTIPMKTSSTLPGAKLEAPPAMILGASLLPLEVRVSVPLAADTGDYTVTLATANGLRSATATLHVTGVRTLIGPQLSSVKSIKDSAKELRKYMKATDMEEIRRGNTFDLPVALPGAGSVTGTFTGKLSKRGKSVLLGKDTRKIKYAGTVSLHLVATKKARKVLGKGRSLKGKLVLRYTPKGSKKSKRAALTITLK